TLIREIRAQAGLRQMTEETTAAQSPAPDAGIAAERVRRAIGALRDALEELESALAAVGTSAAEAQASSVEAPLALAQDPSPVVAPDQAWAAWSRPVDTPPSGAWGVPPAPQPSMGPEAGPEAG